MPLDTAANRLQGSERHDHLMYGLANKKSGFIARWGRSIKRMFRMTRHRQGGDTVLMDCQIDRETASAPIDRSGTTCAGSVDMSVTGASDRKEVSSQR